MKYYPLNLNLSGKKVVVIGGGALAMEKIKALVEAGAQVSVIAPQVSQELKGLIQEGRIQWKERKYQKGDFAGATLAFGATGGADLNRILHQEAQEKGLFFNAVDQPGECDFIAPARISRGDLLITISTAGQAPFVSKALRERLEQLFGAEYEMLIKIMGYLRQYLIERGRREELLPFFEKQGDALLKALQKKDFEGVDRIVGESFGKISLEEFQIR